MCKDCGCFVIKVSLDSAHIVGRFNTSLYWKLVLILLAQVICLTFSNTNAHDEYQIKEGDTDLVLTKYQANHLCQNIT